MLIRGEGGAFELGREKVELGVRLGYQVDPELFADLLPHVAQLALLDRGTSGRLGSASARQSPGLILMPCPLTAVEVAEALVHEGAHQKIFDLAVTRDLVGLNARDCPLFTPSWAPAGVAWPLEQVVAAWHAYLCLSRFCAALPDSAVAAAGPGSLLPMARARCEELGGRLVGCGRFLGRAAHQLIEMLIGSAPHESWRDISVPIIPGATHQASGEKVEVVRLPSGSRSLAGWGGISPQVFWVDTAGLGGVES